MDRLAPYVQRDDERFPGERQEQEEQEDGLRQTSEGDDISSLEEDAEEVDPVSQATTSRAQRARRRPAWQSAFELE